MELAMARAPRAELLDDFARQAPGGDAILTSTIRGTFPQELVDFWVAVTRRRMFASWTRLLVQEHMRQFDEEDAEPQLVTEAIGAFYKNNYRRTRYQEPVCRGCIQRRRLVARHIPTLPPSNLGMALPENRRVIAACCEEVRFSESF